MANSIKEKPEIQSGPAIVGVRLDNGCRFEFAKRGDLLLGLQKVSVGGVELKTDRTIQRPVLAQEWDRDRMIWPLLRFVDARAIGKGVEIVCELLGTTDEKAFLSFFVFGGNHDRALAEGMTPALQPLKQKADAADGTMRQAVENSAGASRTPSDLPGAVRRSIEVLRRSSRAVAGSARRAQV